MAHGLEGALDVEAVAEDAVEDGRADGGVVVCLGGHVEGPGAEVLAAAATAAVFCIGDVQPGDLVVGQGADAAVAEALAGGAPSAVRAGGGLGGAADLGDPFGFGGVHGLCPWVKAAR